MASFLIPSEINLKGGQSTAFIYSGVHHFGEKEDLVYSEFSRSLLLKENYLTSCALIPRILFLELGGMCTSIRHFEDYDFWLRLVGNGLRGKLLREPLFHYRRHSSGRSAGVYSRFSQEEYMRELRENNPAAFGDLPPFHPLASNLPCRKPLVPKETFSLPKQITMDPYPNNPFPSLLAAALSLPRNHLIPFLRSFDLKREQEGKSLLAFVYIIPWMVAGGADLYDLHMLTSLRETLSPDFKVHITLVITIDTFHRWEPSFSSLVDEIFYLPRISNETMQQQEILDFILVSRRAAFVVTRNNDPGYLAVKRWRRDHLLTALKALDIQHLENKEFESRSSNPQPGWVEKSQLFHSELNVRLLASDQLLRHVTSSFNVAADKFRVIYPAMNTSLFLENGFLPPPKQPLYSLLQNKKTLLGTQLVTFSGRFEEQKDPLLWIEVAKAMKKAMKGPVAFLMIGDGWLRPQVEFQVRQWGIYDSFFFPGMLEHQDALRFVELSDLLLLTSLYEGVPLVITEGFASPLFSFLSFFLSFLYFFKKRELFCSANKKNQKPNQTNQNQTNQTKTKHSPLSWGACGFNRLRRDQRSIGKWFRESGIFESGQSGKTD